MTNITFEGNKPAALQALLDMAEAGKQKRCEFYTLKRQGGAGSIYAERVTGTIGIFGGEYICIYKIGSYYVPVLAEYGVAVYMPNAKKSDLLAELNDHINEVIKIATQLRSDKFRDEREQDLAILYAAYEEDATDV